MVASDIPPLPTPMPFTPAPLVSQIDTNTVNIRDGVTVTVTGAKYDSVGRLLIIVNVINDTNDDVRPGLSHETVYFVDNFGRQYELVSPIFVDGRLPDEIRANTWASGNWMVTPTPGSDVTSLKVVIDYSSDFNPREKLEIGPFDIP